MSSIKPPGGKPPIEPGGPLQSEGPEATGPSFGDALQSAREAQATSEAAPAGPAAGAEPIAELARALERGELDAEQALEQLLHHAVGSVEHRLSAEERSELLAMLRSALEHDPALAELKAHLG